MNVHFKSECDTLLTLIQESLYYKDGSLIRKITKGGQVAGTVAGSNRRDPRYRHVRVGGRLYPEHHII